MLLLNERLLFFFWVDLVRKFLDALSYTGKMGDMKIGLSYFSIFLRMVYNIPY